MSHLEGPFNELLFKCDSVIAVLRFKILLSFALCHMVCVALLTCFALLPGDVQAFALRVCDAIS